jgi:hypothetical protein
MGIRVAKFKLDFMRFFPESNNKTAMLPILERLGTPEFGVIMRGSTSGITKKKGSF